MRIALFHDLPSGGAKRTLYELVKRLVARHSIDLYSLATADDRYCDVRPLVRTWREVPFAPAPLFRRPFGRINQLQRWRDLRRLLTLSQRLAAQIDAQSYDVLFAEPSIWTQAPPLLVHAATPSVYHCHEPPRALYEPDLVRDLRGWQRSLDRIDPLIILYRTRARRIDRDATRAARLVLTNSRFTRERARQIYGVESRLLYNGVDVERFRPLEAGRRRREVLSVGAIQPSKGFEFVISSLARIPPPARPALRIVGNSQAHGERAHLTRLAAAGGVDLVIEVGVSDALLAQRYAEAALFAYAPHREPFGLAPLEAMACATPVVGVAEGGVLETVVDDVSGRLVRRDAQEFADAVRTLLDDETARQRLGTNGRDLVSQHWSWEVAAARLDEALATVNRTGT